MKLEKVVFEFVMRDKRTYSAHWCPNTTAADLDQKYEVEIYRGGGFKISYYSNRRICEKNSKEYIEEYLNSLSGKDAKWNSKVERRCKPKEL